MPLQIIRNDLTKMECDAIVNAANRRLRGGGGVDGAIHTAAGRELHEECMSLGGCEVGCAKITKGYRLPCRYIIHTVGPRWFGGMFGEAEKLASCYRSSLRLAREYGCHSVAFPLIASGAYTFPKKLALEIAVREISRFLLENEMLVYLVVYDQDGFRISTQLFSDIKAYIDQRYVDVHSFDRSERSRLSPAARRRDAAAMPQCAPPPAEAMEPLSARSLDELMGMMDESFSQMLLRKIDEKGMSDAQCYKKANIDRKLFSKIRSDAHYKPSKATVLAFAIALELPLEEVRELLMKAGFALSHSDKADLIIEYFIMHGNYNIFEINEALFAFDQRLLGA